MRVMVVYEKRDEVEHAANLAEVLALMAGNLAAYARVKSDGSIEMSMSGYNPMPRVLVSVVNGVDASQAIESFDRVLSAIGAVQETAKASAPNIGKTVDELPPEVREIDIE